MTIGAARLGRAATLLGGSLVLYALLWLPTIGHRAIGALDPPPTMGEAVERLRAGLASGPPLRRHYLRLMADTNTSSVGVRAEFLDLFLRETLPRGHTLRGLVAAGRLPADTHIALGGVGVIPYTSDLRTFDIYALTNREVAANPPLEDRRMAHDRLALLEQLRAAGVDLLHPRVRSQGWLDYARSSPQLVAQTPPQGYALIDEERALVAFMPHDEDTLNRRFPGLRFARLEFRSVATIDREFGYALSRSPDGRAEALSRWRLETALPKPPTRIPIVRTRRRSSGSLDSVATVPQPLGGIPGPDFVLAGWAFDEDRGSTQDIVAFTGDGMAPSKRVHLTSRPDVTAVAGPAAERSGFVMDARADSGDVARSGFVVLALFEDGTASRLAFRYLPIESDWTGRETLPVSDGRRLAIVPPLPGVFDGSLEHTASVDGQTVLKGWAVDIERAERPRQIVAYRDGEYLASYGLNRERPKIAEAVGKPGLRRIGFRGVVPGSAAVTALRPNYRVFAVMARGVAVELRFDTTSAPAAESPPQQVETSAPSHALRRSEVGRTDSHRP